MYRFYLGAILFFFSLPLAAQSALDWITDPVGSAESYISTQVSTVAHEAWEGFLDDDIKKSLSEDAQKIANYDIDSSYLHVIDSTYEQHCYGNVNYNEATKRLNNILTTYIHVVPKGGFSDYGNGAILSNLMSQASTIKTAYPNFSQLDLFLQNHPNLKEQNNKWIGIKSLHNNIQHLYYWGILSKQKTFDIPSKYKLPCSEDLVMKADGMNLKYFVNDSMKHKIIAQISFPSQHTHCCMVDVYDIAMLNYTAIPNATYYIDNIIYTTDQIGRITNARQTICPSDKHKSSLNNKHLKPKMFITNPMHQPYAIANLKYNGTISYLNIIPVHNTKENKQAIKELNKIIKESTKHQYYFEINTTLQYRETNTIPNNIIISINNTQFYLQ